MFIFQKLRFICLLLLALWLVACKDEKAPEKFYDKLKAKQTAEYYTVQPGDTLSGIGIAHERSYIDIARWNNIPPPYRIVAGQKLTLFKQSLTTQTQSPLDYSPSPLAPTSSSKLPIAEPKTTLNGFSFETYNVKKGDTLYSISRHFKVDHYLISSTNNILSPNRLYVGQKLKIPNIKQKHSEIKIAQNQLTITKNLQINSQKTSIISNNNENMLKFYCQWPVSGKIVKNFFKTGNRGVEISGQAGQKVKAVAAGKVVAVNTSLYGHGKFIVIKHNKLFMTSYSNNRRTLVKLGQKVKQGQVIAEIGQIGYKPPILKFEIRKNGKSINPVRFLPRR